MVTKALKEWALAVKALETGDQILLLRKGGLIEGGGRFRLEADRFWMFPTRYHQEADVVKPSFRRLASAAAAEAPPEDRLRIHLLAEAAETIPITDRAAVQAVDGFHIWSAGYMEDRFDWNPRSPLHLVLVRAYRLPTVLDLPMRADYGGCTSWVDLDSPVSTDKASPVLEDGKFQERRNAIHNALSILKP